MADRFAILGQLFPDSTAEAVLYTVPVPAAVSAGAAEVAPKSLSAQTQTVVSSIIVCNRHTSGVTYRIRVQASGAGDLDKDYLFYDTSVSANRTHVLSLGLTLSAGDLIKVATGTADKLSFTAMGIEVT